MRIAVASSGWEQSCAEPHRPQTGQYTIYRTAGGPGELSNTYVISIVEDRSGYLWFGTSGGGLNRFDRRTGQFKVYRHDPADSSSLSDDLVYCLFVDREGAFWVEPITAWIVSIQLRKISNV